MPQFQCLRRARSPPPGRIRPGFRPTSGIAWSGIVSVSWAFLLMVSASRTAL